MDVDRINEALETAYTGGFEALVSVYPSHDGVQGQFFDRGTVYDYRINEGGVEFLENRSDSEYVAEYFRARMDAQGIRCDSENPYEYWRGRMQVNLDAMRKKAVCKQGTPCGNQCIPRGKKCRVGASGASRAALKRPVSGRKANRGEMIKKILGTAAGVTATAGIAAAGLNSVRG